MKPVDLSGLIKGLMVVIGIAIMMGKLDELRVWATLKALAPRNAVRTFDSGGHPRNL